MFFLLKIISYCILPPGIFILIGVLSLFFLFARKNILSRIFFTFLISIIYLLSIEPVKDALLSPLENKYKPIDLHNTIFYSGVDYIVVLGGGIIDFSPDENMKSSPTPEVMKRLYYAYRLYKTTGLPIVASGGRVFKNTDVDSEAEVSSRIFESLSIPSSKIMTEDRSINTWENAVNVKSKFKPKKIILVTSASHLPRSVYCFVKQGIECIAAPCDYKINRNKYGFSSFLPSIDSLKGSTLALYEYFGQLSYVIRY